MIKIQFLSVQALKNKSVIEHNVDEKKLNIAIQEFQEFELKKILTLTEYNRFSDELVKVQNGTIPALSDDDKELLDHITPVMVYGSLWYSIPAIHTKWTNEGLKEDVALNATSGSKSEARSEYGFKKDAAKSALIDFLKARKDNPVTCGDTSDDTTFNFTGVALEDEIFDEESFYRNVYYKTTGRRFRH